MEAVPQHITRGCNNRLPFVRADPAQGPWVQLMHFSYIPGFSLWLLRVGVGVGLGNSCPAFLTKQAIKWNAAGAPTHHTELVHICEVSQSHLCSVYRTSMNPPPS